MWQAHFVADRLRSLGHDVSLLPMTTSGDRIQDRFLHEVGGKGLFTKELEEAMARGEAHLAVHSLKDLPVVLPEGFELAAVLARHAPGDVMIADEKFPLAGRLLTPSILQNLGIKKIGTASVRRMHMLKSNLGDVECVGLRGNVGTRIRKLKDEGLDAIILAEASLDRLELKTGLNWGRLSPDWFLPCPGQGALAIEIDAASSQAAKIREVIAPLKCLRTSREVTLERAVLRELGGDCTIPVGCFARSIDENSFDLRVIYFKKQVGDTESILRFAGTVAAKNAVDFESVAKQVVQDLK